MAAERTLARLSLRLVLAVVALLAMTAAGLCQGEAYVVGVVPMRSTMALAANWTPLLAWLQRQTGLPLFFETAKDIPTFEKRLAEGRYDIAYMNPQHYVVFHNAVGYTAFAREKSNRIRGIVVVPKASPLKTLADLAGRPVAFPSPGSFAATLLPMAALRRQDLVVAPQYVGSHDSVYLAVAKGYFPAGGGIRRTFEKCPPEVRGSLRVLWESPPYTSHPLAAHPRVPRSVVDRLTQALVALDSDPVGQVLLPPLAITGFEAGVDSDWDDIRTLGLRLPPPQP